MRTKCTCHGVSGSCSVRTCWRALTALSRAGAALAREAGRAAAVPARAPRPLRRARARLRYVTPSPDYCEPDPAAGSLGTHGRSEIMKCFLCKRCSVQWGYCMGNFVCPSFKLEIVMRYMYRTKYK